MTKHLWGCAEARSGSLRFYSLRTVLISWLSPDLFGHWGASVLRMDAFDVMKGNRMIQRHSNGEPVTAKSRFRHRGGRPVQSYFASDGIF
ncbi:hypothetical protein AVEN_71713-1 [Araneus ventricosus]|uniref:Uncharacterized protein n=1 Tax=Araneus ventricosus TaxID=182803 RepID=A0A4Y2VND7_ARAVE|nr:hypothetical protein AVEN_71713-1 [Araneus ventricosus]